MNNKKVSFDFDGTLSYKTVQYYAKSLIDSGYDVHIVTSRYKNIEDYFPIIWKNGNYDLLNIANILGISIDKIHFTNMKDKYLFFSENEGFLWHLDDDSIELKKINKYTKTIGISVNGSNYKNKCNKILI